jgi:hypothetical protein
MSLESLVIVLTLLAISILWIGAPLFNRKLHISTRTAVLAKQREQIVVRYERLLSNLRDLEEDFTAGKMQADEFEYEHEKGIQAGIQLLRELDAFDTQHAVLPQAAAHDATPDVSADLDDAIEQAVSRYRGGSNQPHPIAK